MILEVFWEMCSSSLIVCSQGETFIEWTWINVRARSRNHRILLIINNGPLVSLNGLKVTE